jgi:uncharacterized protein (TIGR03067 family)
MKKLVTVLAVVLLVAADKPKDDAGKKDLDKLQGTWSYVSFEINGQKMPADELKRMSITYEGNKWTVKQDDKVVVSGTQKLDPTKKPHQADSLIVEGEGKGTTMLGIYELKGDTMKACFDPSGKERPTSFTPKEGQLGGVLKRGKK